MLKDVQPGKRARIRHHHATGPMRRRFLDLGLLPETEIDVIGKAPFGDPIQCRIGNCCLTLRNEEAACIEVDYEPAASEE
ncbi:MAG: ferrous iron transport protein A [Deltaproteobacteria bacterium]|jgi:ferrous iron transport protein A|nr:ferrous iron transport protein A [Deltaproteobacteria bacterium]